LPKEQNTYSPPFSTGFIDRISRVKLFSPAIF